MVKIITNSGNYNKLLSDAENRTCGINADGIVNFNNVAMIRNTNN